VLATGLRETRPLILTGSVLDTVTEAIGVDPLALVAVAMDLSALAFAVVKLAFVGVHDSGLQMIHIFCFKLH